MPSIAVGDSPVEFMDDQGIQVSIPLSSLAFDANNTLTAANWPGYPAYKAQVDPILKYLATTGAIQPGNAQVLVPAMIVTAADPGATGNNLQVTFSNVTPDPADPTNPAKTTFDAAITEHESFTGLGIDNSQPNFVKTVVGTETAAGSQPAAVHLLDADTPALPRVGSYPLTGGGASTKAKAAIDANSGGGAAFTVEARKNGADGKLTTVAIADVDDAANTFSMAVDWSQSITGIKLADLPSKLQGAGYAILVSAPGSGAFVVPAPGTYGLQGGAAAQAGRAASTTVVAVQ